MAILEDFGHGLHGPTAELQGEFSCQEKNVFFQFEGPSAFGPSRLQQHLQDTHVPEDVKMNIHNQVILSFKIGHIPVKDCDFRMIFETRPPEDLTLTIPTSGESLDAILKKTGLKSLDAIVGRFQALAKEEDLGILVGEDPDEQKCSPGNGGKNGGVLLVNIHKKDSTRHPAMKPGNMAFIEMFDHVDIF